jgi:hypothetical protein
VIGGAQPCARPDTDMGSFARRYVHEGYAMGLSPVSMSYYAERAFAMQYRRLQSPFDPQLAPTQSISSNNRLNRIPNEQDLSGSFYKAFGSS